MEPEQAAMVAWVRAVEETDPAGEVLSGEERHAATRAAAGEVGAEAFLAKRAERLATGLAGDWSVPGTLRWRGWAKAGLVGAAFLGGVVVDRFEGGDVINVLAFPLLGLLAWNLVLYVVMLSRGVWGGGDPRWGSGALMNWGRGHSGGALRERFVRYWWPMVSRRESCGVKAAFHLAAAAAALGVVCGMYWRGLATEYLATWESTFLSAEVATRFLGVVLGPASSLSGIDVPVLREAAASKEETARWIHLFAITAAIVIVVPRVVLAGVSAFRAKRLGANLRCDGGGWSAYEEGLRNSLRGGATVVYVVPFASELGKAGREAVRGYVVERWGGGAVVEFGEVLRYGCEDEFVEQPGGGAGCVTLVVCQLTATPEDEVQGRLLRELRARREGDVVLLVDGRGFRERFGAMPEYGRRLDERRSAWLSVIRGEGFETVIVGGEA